MTGPLTDGVRERFRGALLGLAAGDALGTTLEFRVPGTFDPITNMVGGGPFGLPAGYWTDDTSMALCLAESLVERDAFDAVDQLQRYLRWLDDGHLSSTGTCFDIGNTTRNALERFRRTGEPYPGADDDWTQANGSLMRLAPAPLFFAADFDAAIAHAGDSSRTTHGHRACIDACMYFGGLIAAAVRGVDKAELLSERFHPGRGRWDERALYQDVGAVAAGSFWHRDPPEVRGSGYVVAALEAALWAFSRSDDFETGALLAVNLGDDADTTGAIYGQLAGAYYGEPGIPKRWLKLLAQGELIRAYADRLFDAAQRQGPGD